MLKLRARLSLVGALAVVVAVLVAVFSSSSSARPYFASAASARTAASAFTPSGSGGLALIGSGGPQAAESQNPFGIKAETGTAAQKVAVAAAAATVKKIGKGTLPKGITIGLEEIINSVPSAQRGDGQLIYALRELGFNVIPCDGAGDPTMMASCMSSLVSQGVKAIVSLATDPSLIAQGMQAAKAKGIPMMAFAGAVGPGLWTRVYYNNDVQAGQVLAAYVIGQLKAHGGGSVWINNYPASWASLRTNGMLAALKANPSIKLAGETTVPSTNPIAGTQQQVITQYTQAPNTKAYWFAYDSPGAAAAQALASKDGGKPWPVGPLVVTFHDDQQANALLRAGQITAVADEDYDASAFETADALAQMFAKKTVPPSDTGAGYDGHVMNFYPIITKANDPKPGTWPEPAFDVVSYFTEKWHLEFGRN